ncbi:hypothetical protein BC940DRAFT_146078 [Gongronella butleri]|nr:hypothetical protein BC940DRAFT_146078 [Gongronella butleri]
MAIYGSFISIDAPFFLFLLASTVWLFLWATALEVVGVYPLTVLLLGTFLGQRRFYGRLVYRGWGRWMLPQRAQQAWLASGWI